MSDLGEALDRIGVLVDQRLAEIQRLRAALEECLEYFEGRSDADYNGYSFVANEEMNMAMMIKEAIGT